jgi:RNA polymerase sigma-70 factor (ECF subfamily)
VSLDLLAPASFAPPSFAGVYEEHFPFVWRNARRLGIPESHLDDVVQEVFLVVHRKLSEFEGRSSLRTWLFGIVLRTVRDHWRTVRRKSAEMGPQAGEIDVDTVHAPEDRGPHAAAAQAEAVRRLHALLDTLGQEKREVFVLAELEQLSVVEIAELLEVNLNTAYARLRAARAEFEAALVRQRASDEFLEAHGARSAPRSVARIASAPPAAHSTSRPPPLPARARELTLAGPHVQPAVRDAMRVR